LNIYLRVTFKLGIVSRWGLGNRSCYRDLL